MSSPRYSRVPLRLALRSLVVSTLAIAGVAAAQSPFEPFASDEPAPERPEVEVTVFPSHSTATPGGQLGVAIVFEHREGWHVNPNEPVVPEEMGTFSPIPTTIEIDRAERVITGPIQWPETHAVEVRFTGPPILYEVYEGTAVAYMPIVIDPDAETGATASLALSITFQACDDARCLFPQTVERTVEIPIVASTAGAAPADAALFTDFDLSTFRNIASWSDELAAQAARTGGSADEVAFNVFGLQFAVASSGLLGLGALLLLAALGGFLLNLTPCVLPVIPLKIMGLSQSAANPSRTLALGVSMSAGVIAFWLAIGGAIAFISGFDAISTLFQQPLFSVGVGVFIAVMGAGMLGVFTVKLPKAVYMVNPSHETLSGSFLFGVMTAILSTPCTAPFMGAASAWAATQASGVTLVTFASIGAGMALPYLILSANPKLVSRVPRTGPASELVKQVMGLFMFAVAAFFLGIGASALFASPLETPSKLHWWFVAGFSVIAAGWLGARMWRITKSPFKRVVVGALALAIAVGAVMAAYITTRPSKIPWVYYTPELLTEARERGSVVLIDFTAEWCLNCKTLEAVVLESDEIVTALQEADVVTFKVDLTGDNPNGRALLKELNWVGIPLLVIEGPGLAAPARFGDGYTVGLVADALEQAGG